MRRGRQYHVAARSRAERGTGRAKGSPKPWKWEASHAMGGSCPVGENRKRCTSHLTKAEPAGQERTRGPPCKGRYGAGGSEEAGRVMEPRHAERRGQQALPQGGSEGPAAGCQWPEGSSPRRAQASVEDTTGVEERGLPAEGGGGNVGEPPVALPTSRMRGAGDHRPRRGGAASTPPRAPRGHHAQNGSRPGSGKRATSAAPRDGPGGRRSGAESRGRGGTVAHGPHGRAGDAGPPVVGDGQPGATVRAPPVPPQLPQRAAPAARDPDRSR